MKIEMIDEKENSLGLTFTYGMSLEKWVNLGLFDREKQIYEEHLRKKHFERIIWFTYGIGDGELRNRLVHEGRLDERVFVVCPPKWVHGSLMTYIYSLLCPYINADVCRELTVIKSNQMGGARVAIAIGKRFKVLTELRTGYTYTLFYNKRIEDCVNSKSIQCLKMKIWRSYYRFLEQKLYNKCDIATVASKHDRDYIISEYSVCPDKVKLLSNYIDCNLFCNSTPIEERRERMLFVGRLSQQKNLISLISAVSKMNIGLDLYGDGEQREELEHLIRDNNADIVLKGKIANASLPAVYNSYKFFVLPSFYEGMPKTLLEAMSCGCVCFGTDVEGIKEVLIDEQTGIIMHGTDSEIIGRIIERWLANCKVEDIRGISKAAREYIERNHSLNSITDLEQEYILSIRND